MKPMGHKRAQKQHWQTELSQNNEMQDLEMAAVCLEGAAKHLWVRQGTEAFP